ncbi:MAG: hypothetical protein NVS1B2_23010 [Vulcanimicrobiaceae bacterium]
MVRRLSNLAFSLAVALLVLGAIGFARASVTEFGRLESDLVSSAAPTLLGPINELGRNGWNCIPERMALAKNARDAQLPLESER